MPGRERAPKRPRATPSPRCGGDTLTIWRWQGKASRIKALTAPESRASRREPHSPAFSPPSVSRNCRFSTLPLALRGRGSAVSSMVSGTL